MHTLITKVPALGIARPLFELCIKIGALRIGIAVGPKGLLVAAQRKGQRWVLAVGKWN